MSPATVLRRWRAGELPGYRLGSNVLRFSARDVDEWLEARRGRVAHVPCASQPSENLELVERSTYDGGRVR